MQIKTWEVDTFFNLRKIYLPYRMYDQSAVMSLSFILTLLLQNLIWNIINTKANINITIAYTYSRLEQPPDHKQFTV